MSPGVQPLQWEPHCHSMPAAMVGLWHLAASLSAKNGVEGFAMLELLLIHRSAFALDCASLPRYILCVYIYIELQLSFGLGFCWYPFRLCVPACLFLCPSFYFLLCQRGPNGFPLPHSDSYDVWQSATPPTDITEFPFAGVRGLHIHNPNMRNVFRSQH